MDKKGLTNSQHVSNSKEALLESTVKLREILQKAEIKYFSNKVRTYSEKKDCYINWKGRRC
jgi:hypothetical protein